MWLSLVVRFGNTSLADTKAGANKLIEEKDLKNEQK